MNKGKLVFAQLMEFLPRYEFDKCVKKYDGNYRVRGFNCWKQFLCMAFAQITYRESLRDIEASLFSQKNKLYHLGIKGGVSRNNLSNANHQRDWRIYQNFALKLIEKAKQLYAGEEFSVRLDNATYALDSTTIDLCLSLFDWAQFRQTKAAIKLHTLLDLRGNIPSIIHITSGKTHDVNILDQLQFEAGAIYLMDRGYLDFMRLHRITLASAFFVTRSKTNVKFIRHKSHKTDRTIGVIADQTVTLASKQAKEDYPDKLRRIAYKDPDTGKCFVFITNNFILSAKTIADLYKARWQVELFFKWIKQHLRIKCFFGTSENAVKTQVWICIATYVLVAIIKKQLKLKQSLYSILQTLSVCVFEKTPISQLFSNKIITSDHDEDHNQLKLLLS